ncbi:MAG TPA: hypothetical protein PL176_00670 [Kiritimatiellia bacterium]|jgi:hypothetical protein|nr:MAG: hypothetical protein BWX70_02579 [Verrucomicrobia bacterium ADurb.Bin070]HPO36495.1 hypothetical protein [Kiritimatiellia bacterium]
MKSINATLNLVSYPAFCGFSFPGLFAFSTAARSSSTRSAWS